MLRSAGSPARLLRALAVAAVVCSVPAPARASTAGVPAAEPSSSEPWLPGAFSAEPAAVARAARDLGVGDAEVVLLFRDDGYAFDPGGRMTYRRRWVYRITSAGGLEDWSVSEVAWNPEHQRRPRLRARVVDPDGGERWLAADRLQDLSADEAGLSGGRRLLRGPLPVTVGSVVEEEAVIADHRPLFAAGVSARHLLVMPAPVLRGRLTLEAPASLPLRFAVRLADLEPRREAASGRVRLTFDYGGVPAAGPVETSLPPDVPRYPQVAFSTGETWPAVAEACARAVDEKIAESDPGAVLAWLPRTGAESQLERIAELLDGVRGNVRFPGYAAAGLDPADLSPSAPLETLRRGTGDAVDAATLLTAALRAEGIIAYVALLRAGYGADVDPELPGMGRFNHALVVVPAAEPIWIDPVDGFSRPGELASDRQGRWALVASTSARGLLRTWEARPSDNATLTSIEVTMAEEGPARIVETSTYRGAAERRQRVVSAGVDAAERRRGYEAYLKAAYRAEALGEVEETEVADLSSPFRLRLEALRAGRAWTADGEAALAVDLSYLITALPRELLVAGGERRGPFFFHEPFVVEWRYRVEPPPRMRLRALPVDFDRPLGTGTFSRTARLEGRVVDAEFRLDSGPRRLSPEQFETFRADVEALLEEPALVLWFDHGSRPARAASGRRPPKETER